LYILFREWRGDLNDRLVMKHSRRRIAFWDISASLSKELSSIFLPCLSLVTGDLVLELTTSAKLLCAKGFDKSRGGKKKRKLHVDESTDGVNDMIRILYPLLACLETSLKADTQEGGNWVRADDSQRYTTILDPLGKLLQCTFPSSVDKSLPYQSFHELVIGGERSASVSSCMCALASAAGNEQLWKPLNLAVLDACACDDRSEVRRGGITCLISLMQALGEEYMVLLPECLPTLSELLEDTDERIAQLTRETIALAEETIGESLAENLR
jgi:U3 small nucleolar RNA-associated protein 10